MTGTLSALGTPSDLLRNQVVLLPRVVHRKGLSLGHLIEDVDPKEYVLNIHCNEHYCGIKQTLYAPCQPSDLLLYQVLLFPRVVHWKGRRSGHLIEDIPKKYVVTINRDEHNY